MREAVAQTQEPVRPAIVVEGVTKRYGDFAALSDVSLEIGRGEFISIIGTSGSGKTTLLNVIGGLDRAYEGRVTVESQDLANLSDFELSRFRNESIGFVFQHFHLLPHLSCRENVLLPSFFTRNARGPVEPEEALRRVGLGDKIDAMPGKLSGGQKQRVAIARALLLRPKIILCDEPTGNLDRRTGEQILELFDALNREEGLTLVIITHEEHISRAAARTLRLEAGQIAAT
jgi:ABC-type lipoprotein export system ATPase subunit